MITDKVRGGKDVEAYATFGKWLMLPCAIISFGISLGVPISLSIMFLDWQETFQVSRAHTAVIHSTCSGFLLGAAIIPGYAMKRFGARLTALTGSVLASTGFLLSIFATSIEYLTVTVGVLGGLGCCFVQITSIPCITAVFHKYLSVIISSCTIFSAVLVVLAPYLYSYLLEEYSWRGLLGILACITLNTCITGMIMTSITYRKRVRLPSSSCASDESLTLKSLIKESEDINVNIEKTRKDVGQDGDKPSGNLINLPAYDEIQTSVKDQVEINGSSSFHNSERKVHSVKKKNIGNILESIKCSDWKFLADVVFIAFCLHCILFLSCVFSFPLLITEFAKNRGFGKSTGVFFFSLIFFASIFGRIVSALLNLSPRFHSITLYTCFSIGSGFAMLFFSYIEDYMLTVICVSAYGICYGAMIGLQMKCVLDIQSVDSKSYPLALGVCITVEGIADFAMPVLIGYSVDTTGSYTFILFMMGCVGLASSFALGTVFKFCNNGTDVKGDQTQEVDL